MEPSWACPEVSQYDTETVFSQFFLTEEACSTHIQAAAGQYQNPEPYIVSVSDSEELRTLIGLVTRTNWE